MSKSRQPTAFSGTATYYLQYRPPYPDAFLAELRSLAKTSGTGLLLDLACGPGRLSIPMAMYFKDVLAVDIESEMIEVGKEEADRCGVTNITWLLERAENLDLAPDSVELITIGDAFHRLDQKKILNLSLKWLQPGGALATLGAETVWRGQEEWQRILIDIVNRHTNNSLGDPNQDSWGGPADLLREAGLKVVEHTTVMELTWSCDSIVGFIYSTSVASRRVLGDSVNNFETELRQALLEFEPRDRFVSNQKFGFTLGIN